MTYVIQRTDDGFARTAARTTSDRATHTRAVDLSCDKNVGKCVKQVEVGSAISRRSKEP
jgi:hypothetical protein